MPAYSNGVSEFLHICMYVELSLPTNCEAAIREHHSFQDALAGDLKHSPNQKIQMNLILRASTCEG